MQRYIQLSHMLIGILLVNANVAVKVLPLFSKTTSTYSLATLKYHQLLFHLFFLSDFGCKWKFAVYFFYPSFWCSYIFLMYFVGLVYWLLLHPMALLRNNYWIGIIISLNICGMFSKNFWHCCSARTLITEDWDGYVQNT